MDYKTFLRDSGYKAIDVAKDELVHMENTLFERTQNSDTQYFSAVFINPFRHHLEDTFENYLKQYHAETVLTTFHNDATDETYYHNQFTPHPKCMALLSIVVDIKAPLAIIENSNYVALVLKSQVKTPETHDVIYADSTDLSDGTKGYFYLFKMKVMKMNI